MLGCVPLGMLPPPLLIRGIVTALVALPLALLAEMKISTNETTVTITKNGKLVTEYRTDAKTPYLYPVSTPNGPNLARQWPMSDAATGEEKDHPHHRSFWMSHGSVNGHDFWAWTGKTAAHIQHRSVTHSQAKDDSASFTVALQWIANQKTILDETRHIHLRDVDENTRIIDTTSTLTASHNDVVFGDTKEGFFAFRVDRTLRLKGATAKGHILNQQGQTDEACWGQRSPWVAFYGPDEAGLTATIVLMDHQSNLRHPTWWHARDYGLLAANPFGIHDFEKKKDKKLGNHTLKKGQSLTFQYRLMLFQGAPDQKHIEKVWTEFIKSPTTP